MKQHAVLLTDDAQADLQELYDYIAGHDAPAKADAVLKEAQINSSWRAITWLGRSAALLFLQISRYLLQKPPCSPSQSKRRASTRINLRFLNKLEAVVASLSRFPERGAVTKELRDVGIRDYREVYFKP